MGTEFAEITLKTDHILPEQKMWRGVLFNACLLYTSDAADE